MPDYLRRAGETPYTRATVTSHSAGELERNVGPHSTAVATQRVTPTPPATAVATQRVTPTPPASTTRAQQQIASRETAIAIDPLAEPRQIRRAHDPGLGTELGDPDVGDRPVPACGQMFAV